MSRVDSLAVGARCAPSIGARPAARRTADAPAPRCLAQAWPRPRAFPRCKLCRSRPPLAGSASTFASRIVKLREAARLCRVGSRERAPNAQLTPRRGIGSSSCDGRRVPRQRAARSPSRGCILRLPRRRFDHGRPTVTCCRLAPECVREAATRRRASRLARRSATRTKQTACRASWRRASGRAPVPWRRSSGHRRAPAGRTDPILRVQACDMRGCQSASLPAGRVRRLAGPRAPARSHAGIARARLEPTASGTGRSSPTSPRVRRQALRARPGPAAAGCASSSSGTAQEPTLAGRPTGSPRLCASLTSRLHAGGRPPSRRDSRRRSRRRQPTLPDAGRLVDEVDAPDRPPIRSERLRSGL